MAKKITSLLLSVLLIIAVFPFSVFAAGTKYRVTVAHTNIYETKSLFSTVLGELQKGDYVFVTETDGDYSRVTQNSTGVTGWVYNPCITYAGETTDMDITGISIFKEPDKKTYIQSEEEFDPTGLVITANLKNGTKLKVTGYKLYIPDFTKEYGEKTVYVTYKPENATVYYSASFTVTVNRIPLKSLSIVSKPTKATGSYIENQILDLSGLELKATYSDGRADRIFTWDEIKADGNFIFTGCHSEADGKKLSYGVHTLNIYYYYSDITCKLNITARKKILTDIKLTTPLSSTKVYSKEIPDLSEIEITAYYDNGEEILLSADDCKITCSPESFVYGSGNILTLTYGTKSIEIDLTYAVLEKTGLRLRLPQKLTYILGEEIDLSALEVYYVYSSGEVEKTTDYTRSEIDLTQTGAQTVTVSSGDFSTTFTIYINPYYQKGDISGDGKVMSEDARLALRASVGLVTLGGNTFNAGDVDEDGNVTAADARLILRASVGLEDFLKDIKNKKI